MNVFSYIDIVAGLAVTNKGLIVAVDSVSPTVFIISEDGNLIHWFDCSDFMREPSDIAINGEIDHFSEKKGNSLTIMILLQVPTFTCATSRATAWPCSPRRVRSSIVSAARRLPASRMVSTSRTPATC